MTIRHVITLTTDLIDCEDTTVKVIDCPKPITLDDTALLQYIFSIALPSERHDIEIEVIENFVQHFSHDMSIDLCFFEKIKGEYFIHANTVELDFFNKETVQKLLKHDMTLIDHRDRTFYTASKDPNNYAIVYDANAYVRACEPQTSRIQQMLGEHHITQKYVFKRHFGYNLADQNVITDVYFFPQQSKIIEHLSTCLSFDNAAMLETREHQITLLSGSSEIIEQVSYQDDK